MESKTNMELINDKIPKGTIFIDMISLRLKTATGLRSFDNIAPSVDRVYNLKIEDFDKDGVVAITTPVGLQFSKTISDLSADELVRVCEVTFPKGTEYICVESGNRFISSGKFNFCTEAGVIEFTDGKYQSTILNLKLAEIIKEVDFTKVDITKEPVPILSFDIPSMEDIDSEITKKVFQTFMKANLELNNTKDSSINNGGLTSYYSIDKNWKTAQDIIEARSMDFSQGNIFKAAFTFNIGRHEATDEVRELNKIIFFAERRKQQILNGKTN